MMTATKALVKELSTLKDKSVRRAKGLFLAEGYNLIKDLDIPARMLLVTQESYLEGIKTPPIECYLVSEEHLSKISGTVTPQGVVGVYDIPDLSIKPPRSRCLVMDGVTDPGNMGTLIRTAVATGYRDIYLIDTTDAYAGKAVRASMGGIFGVNIHEGTAQEVISCLHSAGHDIAILDMAGKNIFDYKCDGDNIALVVGSEAHGISEIFRKHADISLSLPMDKGMESLNASVAGGISMYMLRYLNK